MTKKIKDIDAKIAAAEARLAATQRELDLLSAAPIEDRHAHLVDEDRHDADAGAPVAEVSVESMNMAEYGQVRDQLPLGNPNGTGRRVGAKCTSNGIFGAADDPFSRAQIVAEAQRAGRYAIAGSLIS
jgi:hypothetical protein